MQSYPSPEDLATEPALPSVVARWAERQPGAVFCQEVGGRSVSYGDTVAAARRWAAAFAALGVRRGELVLSMLPPCVDGVQLWLGLGLAGAIEAPVNNGFRGRMLRYVLEDTGARFAVADSRYLERFAELDSRAGLELLIVCGPPRRLPAPGCRVTGAPEFLADAGPGDAALDGPQRHDIGCLIYTSGTTGPSKGVLVPWAQLTATLPARWTSGIGREETQYMPFPMYHVAARTAVCLMARHGGRLVLRETFSVEAFWDDIRRYRCTFALLAGAVPNFLYQRERRPDDAGNPLRTVIMAPLIREHAQFAERFGVEIVTGYNMTEISTPLYFPDGIPDWQSCGRLRNGYPDYEVRLVDEVDREVPEGEVGELIVRSGAPWTLNAGYHGKPEATARAWRNGWFHTGDAFRRDARGHYFFVDRFKDAIRRRGENISSFEVESIVNDHPLIAESAAVAVPAQVGEDEILIFVVAETGRAVDPAELIGFLIPRMPRFMIPRFVEIVDSLPKTEATQRVRKDILRSRAASPARWDREAAGVRI